MRMQSMCWQHISARKAVKGQYAIEYQDITDPANISAQIPDRGTMVATGDYYVTVSL